jgi:hypothetical protein
MKVELTKRECIIIHQSLKDLSWSVCQIMEQYKKDKTDSMQAAMLIQIREKQFCEVMAVLEKFEKLNPNNVLF